MKRIDFLGLIITYKKGEYRRVVENNELFFDIRDFNLERYEKLCEKDRIDSLKSLVMFYEDIYKYLKKECRSDNLYIRKMIKNIVGKEYETYSLNIGLASIVEIYFFKFDREYYGYEKKLKRIIDKYKKLHELNLHKCMKNLNVCNRLEEEDNE